MMTFSKLLLNFAAEVIMASAAYARILVECF